MGQPSVVSDISRHNGNGHQAANESGILYQAGFEAGFEAGRQAGYRQGMEAASGQARPQALEPPAPSRAQQQPVKHALIGLPCPTCGAYFFTDEECPRCKKGGATEH